MATRHRDRGRATPERVGEGASPKPPGGADPVIALPIAASVVALAFGVHLLVRAGRRRTWHEAVWGVALLMFAAASGALALGVADGWSSAEFRTYWLFGAVL